MESKTLKNNLPLLIVAGLVAAVVVLTSAGLVTREPLRDDTEPAEAPIELDSYRGPYSAPRAPASAVRTSRTLPAGTPLELVLDRMISTATAVPGDAVTARVGDPVVVDGRTVIPANALVQGRVVESARSKRFGGRSRLMIEFTSLSVNGRSRPISAIYTALGKKQTKRDAATIAGATAGGAVLGRILGHKKGKEADGTLAGAVVGGAIGTGVAASNRAQHVTLPSGTPISVQLDSSLTV